MKRLLFSIIFIVCFNLGNVTQALAIEDPLSKPNNKIGIHILFTTELEDAAKLINTNGGDWGYVVIPLQANDRDLEKWQHFMNEAARLHVIPIIRLATEGDYFNTHVWRKPRYEDIIDFANFLNSLDWPTKNRYVVVFNEPNRGDEWGGAANPAEYADILSFAVTFFKSLNQDFFIIGGGFDNAAPNKGTDYIDQYRFIRMMNDAVPGIFNQIDGYASHSYPNPAFSQPPHIQNSRSISSFAYERELIKQFANKRLPIFITETGWSANAVDDATRAQYYQKAFETTWNDPDIVAIVPFLLKASGIFSQFSFLAENGSKTAQYNFIEKMKKIKGEPSLMKKILGVATEQAPKYEIDFRQTTNKKNSSISLSHVLQTTFEWMMKL
ncbi:MAG: hypothetical protein KatS3mg089_0501 [Patescibacteria group bacterium]|nr:MAG: hypothetical protein KatS3mg089_0501 [Patescibacteria group bacterium]